MITHCKECDINWLKLGDETQGDEVYEFCPKCKTDMFLEAGTDIVGYIMCPITGRIYDPETGKDINDKGLRVLFEPIRQKVWDETLEAFQDRRAAAEDVYIESGGTIPMEKIERKHHYETI